MYHVPSLGRPFADILTVLTGAECLRAGHDPLVSNPCDPWGRTLNYPRVWLWLGTLVRPPQAWLVGLATALVFFAAVFRVVGRIGPPTAVLRWVWNREGVGEPSVVTVNGAAEAVAELRRCIVTATQ